MSNTEKEGVRFINESIKRCGITQPANNLLTANPDLQAILARYAIHLSPFIENPADGRPLLDTAIESAVTNYYLGLNTSAKFAKLSFVDALLTRATMLVDYDVRYYKNIWNPFGTISLTEFISKYQSPHVGYGVKHVDFDINDYRLHILKIIANEDDIKAIGKSMQHIAVAQEIHR